MQKKIKICGMREKDNILQADALNPDYLGFIFYPPSPRFFGAATIPVIRAKKVGVFVNEPISSLLNIAKNHDLDTIQLHGTESPDICRTLRSSGYEVWKAFNVNEFTKTDELMPYAGLCDYFLFDTKTSLPGGSGKKFNWDKLPELSSVSPFFLSGGIGPEDVNRIKALNVHNMAGVDLNSGFETTPALKDINMLAAFIKKIRN